jgi:hypothetical protein
VGNRSIPAVLAVCALYLLHQDLWFWRSARPLVFGFLPVGLAWHAAYCVVVSLLMLWLTRVAWPSHLDHDRAVADTSRR